MYLFSRQTTLASAASVEWAIKIAGHVTQVTGTEVNVWGRTYSPGFGGVSWTTWHQDLGALEAFSQSIQADATYQQLVQEGAEHTQGGLDDGVMEVVAGEVDPNADPQFVSGVTAVVAGGNIIRGMTAGAEIATRASAITGANTLFVQALTGPYGSIGWLTGHADMASVEASQKAMAADPGWLEFIDSTEGCFVEDPTITQQTLYRKLA